MLYLGHKLLMILTVKKVVGTFYERVEEDKPNRIQDWKSNLEKRW